MAKFYVTYGFGSNLANCFSVVEAVDQQTARAKVAEVIGLKFAFIYNTKDWEKDTPFGPRTQQELYGLKEVPLQAQIKIED